MASGAPSVFQDFRRGVNLQSAPYLLETSEARDARNVHGSVLGSIKKRRGFEKLGTNALSDLDGPPHSLFPVNLASKSLLMVAKSAAGTSDRIVKLDLTGAPVTLKSGLSQGKRWEFVQAPTSGGQGPIFGINGTDTPQYWDGSSGFTNNWTAATGTVPQNARFLIYHQDAIWAAGDPANPATIQSCGLTGGGTPIPDPRNWSTDYLDQVEPNDGQAITAIGACGPYLIVAKARKLYAMPSFESRNYRKISSEIGCIAHRTMVETSRGTMFLSEDLGVCVTDGTDVTPVSDPVLPLLRAAADANAAVFSQACATYYQGSYFLSIPESSSSNDLTLEFQVDTGAWWIHTCASNQFALVDPTAAPILFSASPALKQVDKAFVEGVHGDYGAAFNTYWTSPFLTWGNPHLNKRVRQFRVDGQGEWDLYSQETFEDDPSLLEAEVWEESSSGETFGGGGTFGGVSDEFGPSGGITQRRYPTPSQGWGRAWSLTVANEDTNPMEVFSLAAFTIQRSD